MGERHERYGAMKKSIKKIRKKSVTGRNIFVFRKERISAPICNNCGRELHGIPRAANVQLSKLAKSERRPNRKFGGYYCASCTKELFRNIARGA